MTIYSIGSAAVVSGSPIVVGTNTTWEISEVAGGLFTMNGIAIPIASVESNTQLTLRYSWSASSRAGAYAISLASAQAATSVAILRRIQENVTALRNLSPLGRAVTSAETTEALRQLVGISAGRFQVDASGPFAERAQYDDRPPTFSFLATDQGLIYLREGASGWSEGLVFGKGDDGREIELRADDARIEWRYEGEFDWRGLVDLDLLKGADGREVEFNQSDMHLQWRLIGEDVWPDLVPLSLITGPQGDEAVSTREAKEAAAAALVSETAAKASEEAAALSETAAKGSETAAAASASAAGDARTNAEGARDAALDARSGAEAAELDAREHRGAASASASEASASEETAADSAASAALARDSAVAARSGAETAQEAAIAAKEVAEDAAAASAQARDGSVAAQGGAEDAEASAKLAQSAAEAARDDAEDAATASGDAAQSAAREADTAVLARNDAVAAKTEAIAAGGSVSSGVEAAREARDLAVTAREGAEEAEAGAVEARGGAEAARDAAAQSAADAALFDPTSYYTKDEIDALPVPSGQWADLEGKPDVFPPVPHDHDARYYTKAEINARPVPDTSWDGITGKPEAFPPENHAHDDRYYQLTAEFKLVDGKVGMGTDAPTSELHFVSDRAGGLPAQVTFRAGKAPGNAASVAFQRPLPSQQMLLAFETGSASDPDGYIGTLANNPDIIWIMTGTGGSGSIAVHPTKGLMVGQGGAFAANPPATIGPDGSAVFTSVKVGTDDVWHLGNLSVGVEAGDVVALDSAGKLPSVDGSQLLNLPSGGAAWDALTTLADATTVNVDLDQGPNFILRSAATRTLTFSNLKDGRSGTIFVIAQGVSSGDAANLGTLTVRMSTRGSFGTGGPKHAVVTYYCLGPYIFYNYFGQHGSV